MKVVSVISSDARGGAEFAAVAMLDALAERGHDAVMLTDQPDMVDGTRVAARRLDLGPKLSRRSWRSLALRWPIVLAGLRRGLAAEAPFDVLIVHFKKEQLLAALLPCRLRPRLAWAEWGPVPYQLRRGLPRLLYRRAAGRAHVVMAISEGTRRSVVALGVPADKVEVVPNAIRTGAVGFDESGRRRVREQLGIGPEEFVVGCISRFHPKKRNDVVVDAVARLDGGVRLVLAGDGETEVALRERAERLGARVDFMPTPHRSEVASVLSAFDVSVFCPSPTEGEPRAVALAMLAARPCVATGREGVSDLITPDTGTIVSPDNDVDALVDVLRGYRADPSRRARVGEAARRRAVERFDAPIVAERVERLLSD